MKTSAPNWRSCTAPCWAMTMPTRKLISPMMPSAWTPTTSNCWTTALRRKRRGWRMMLPDRDQQRAEEAEQAEQGAAGHRAPTSPIWPSTRVNGEFAVALASSPADRPGRRDRSAAAARDWRRRSWRRGRAASLWISQAPTVSIRSTSLRSTVEVDRRRSRSSCSESLRTRKSVRLPREAQDTTALLDVSAEVGGDAHCRRQCFKSRPAARR